MSWFGKILKGVGKGLVNAISSVPIVGDIAESIMGDIESDQARSQQMSDSMSMMKYQNDLNMANWETQNAYNTPQMQLQRIMDAGLNPLSVGLDGNTAAQPAAVSGQAAPDISSLLNYQLLNMQTKAQLANLHEDTESKKIANKVAKVRAQKDIKELEADIRFGDRQLSDMPDNEHDWYVDDAGYWSYDENGNHVRSNKPGTSNQRDITREMRYQRELSETEKARYDRYLSEFNSRIQAVRMAIEEEIGADVAIEQLNRLKAEIASIEARTDLTKEQKYDLEMNNNIWRELGVGGKGVEMILRLLLSLK